MGRAKESRKGCGNGQSKGENEMGRGENRAERGTQPQSLLSLFPFRLNCPAKNIPFAFVFSASSSVYIFRSKVLVHVLIFQLRSKSFEIQQKYARRMTN